MNAPRAPLQPRRPTGRTRRASARISTIILSESTGWDWVVGSPIQTRDRDSPRRPPPGATRPCSRVVLLTDATPSAPSAPSLLVGGKHRVVVELRLAADPIVSSGYLWLIKGVVRGAATGWVVHASVGT